MDFWKAAMAATLCCMGTGAVWAQGTHGDADIGAIANISAENVVEAAQLVREGKVYALGVVTGRDTPVWGERAYDIEVSRLGPFGNVTGHDEKLTSHLGIGTQIDGFGHVGVDGIHFGGVPREDFAHPDGLTRFGIESIPPIATRGVLIDMARHFGVETLEPRASFGSADIQAASAAQGVRIGRGDVVLLHMGWLAMEGDPELFVGAQPGIDEEGARWLAELGVVAVGSDSPGLETTGGDGSGGFIPVHVALLAEHGVHILESINTSQLAADEAWEFLFVLGAPRFEGAVQGVVNPVAIR